MSGVGTDHHMSEYTSSVVDMFSLQFRRQRANSRNKWCSEGPYRVLHVVPNTGPNLVLQGTPIEGASKDPHATVLLSTPEVLQSTPHKVIRSTPRCCFGTPCPHLYAPSEIFIIFMTCGTFRTPTLTCGCTQIRFYGGHTLYLTRRLPVQRAAVERDAIPYPWKSS